MLKEIYDFFRHPFGHIVRYSKIYQKLVSEKKDLESEKTNLEVRVAREEKLKGGAYEDLKIKKEELQNLRASCMHRDEYDVLLKKYDELVERIPKIRETISKTLKVCREIHTARDIIEARAEKNEGANRALEEWKKRYAEPLETRLKIAEREAEGLRGFAIGVAADAIMHFDKKAEEIPFAFYDFANEDLYCNKTTLKLFSADEKQKLSLFQLLHKIDKKCREPILASLRSGKGLRHYKAKTSGENPMDLELTTYPFFYNKKPVAVGIFLYDPKYFGHKIKVHKLNKRIEEIVGRMTDMFKIVGEGIKKDIEREGRMI